MRDWAEYFDVVAASPPRATLVAALDAFDRERAGDSGRGRGGGRRLRAVDLGCGNGRDTVEMLRRGWEVVAVDSNAEGLRRLAERVSEEERGRLRTELGSYEDVVWGEADLVNASYSIPHCREGAFAGVWGKIVGSIAPGGRFAGQFFGVRDGWRSLEGAGAAPGAGEERAAGWHDGREFHTRELVEAMLQGAGLRAEMLEEQEEMGKTAMGDAKYWHVFHVVARRG